MQHSVSILLNRLSEYEFFVVFILEITSLVKGLNMFKRKNSTYGWQLTTLCITFFKNDNLFQPKSINFNYIQ